MFLDRIAATLNNAIGKYDNVVSYLSSRAFTVEDVKEYRIGYSRFVNVPEDDHEDRARFMDETWKGKKFENKIVFPIQDEMGRVMGLVGRALDSKLFKVFVTAEAKYVGCFFYGLYQALPAIYESGTAFVVEGSFDCQAFRQAFPNTVATMTSGLYPNQHDYLSNYCKRIVTVFDDDGPGREGAEKAAGFKDVRDVNIGFGDPAKCLETLGRDKFVSYVKRKVKDSLPPF